MNIFILPYKFDIKKAVIEKDVGRLRVFISFKPSSHLKIVSNIVTPHLETCLRPYSSRNIENRMKRRRILPY